MEIVLAAVVAAVVAGGVVLLTQRTAARPEPLAPTRDASYPLRPRATWPLVRLNNGICSGFGSIFEF